MPRSSLVLPDWDTSHTAGVVDDRSIFFPSATIRIHCRLQLAALLGDHLHAARLVIYPQSSTFLPSPIFIANYQRGIQCPESASLSQTSHRIPCHRYTLDHQQITRKHAQSTMITDNDLHRLAVFLGSCAMMLIVLYHFLEVNAKEDDDDAATATKNSKGTLIDSASRTSATATAGGSSATGGGKDR